MNLDSAKVLRNVKFVDRFELSTWKKPEILHEKIVASFAVSKAFYIFRSNLTWSGHAEKLPSVVIVKTPQTSVFEKLLNAAGGGEFQKSINLGAGY